VSPRQTEVCRTFFRLANIAIPATAGMAILASRLVKLKGAKWKPDRFSPSLLAGDIQLFTATHSLIARLFLRSENG